MMQAHAVSGLFPPMSESQYLALRDDIKENGQREAITLWRGQIIDGIHRAKACADLNRESLTRTWEGEESGLTAYVVSLNLHRRHLDESQRAMVGEKVALTCSEAATAREARKAGRPQSSIDNGGKMSGPEAARLFNTSVPSIGKARVVRTHGIPELVAAVEQGDIAVTPAAAIARLPAAEQRAALESPRPRNPNLSNHPTKGTAERVDRTVESLCNFSDVLVEAMPDLNGDKRRATWASRLRDVRTTISRFIVECEK